MAIHEVYRHGDVILRRVTTVPEGAAQCPPALSVVLAEGEVTGHAHTLTGAALEMWELGNRLFASIADQPATLDHQEHGVLAVLPGVYEIVVQRVYHPAEIRRVAD